MYIYVCIKFVCLNNTDLNTALFLSSNSIVSHNASQSCDAKDAEPVEREGTLHVKFTVLDGKVRRTKNPVGCTLREFVFQFCEHLSFIIYHNFSDPPIVPGSRSGVSSVVL